MTDSKHIIVIGAGVTGLTSAIFLADAGYRVTVIGAHVPGDKSIEYTSPWAGAHWLTHALPTEPVQCDWDVQTYQWMSELIASEEKDSSLPRSGLKHNRGYGFYTGPLPEGKFWWAAHVKDFEKLSPSAAPVSEINDRASKDLLPIEVAITYKSISINSPQYLLYLQERAKSSGVDIVKSRLPTTAGLEGALTAAQELAGRGEPDAFLNATGLGAYKLCGDETMYPVRGQTVLVKGEAAAERTRSGPGVVAYCIPRPGSGTTILGGTRDEGNWNEKPDPDITARILEQNSWQVPELLTAPNGGFEVISVQCGLRPGRKGGPRMEYEVINGMKVVHAYGHAGAGYQNSIGSARLVVKLVGESIAGH